MKEPPYVLNLDPAVKNVPFEVNIDIRQSVDYKEVMRQYNLGPNGGIMTCLNLFATKVDQIVGLLEKRAPEVSRIIVDTPGQIECFVWSASGAILLDAVASSFPTVVAYIVDTPRTSSPATFMANMLYACSILYKTKLPMILVFNKTDVKDAEFAREWMQDFESFQAALREDEAKGEASGSGGGYMGSLLNSMSLMLEEFYKQMTIVGVSAMTGKGIDEFLEAVEEKVDEYKKDYLPELQKAREKREKEKEAKREKELSKLMGDLEVDNPTKPVQADVLSDFEDDNEEEGGLVEPDEDEERDDEDGLTDRYEKALHHDDNSKMDEDSWVRYLNANK